MCQWNVFVYVDCGCVGESPRLVKQCPFRTGFKHYIAAGKPPDATGIALQRACIETVKISTLYCAGECKRCKGQVGGQGFAGDGETARRGDTQARAQLSDTWLETFETELRAAGDGLKPDTKGLLLQFADEQRNSMFYEAA